MNTGRLKGSFTASGSPLVADEAHFLAVLPLIDDVVKHVSRRHHLSETDAEDFRSEARIHFLDRNYEVLRRFEGRSSLATYITVVIQHLFLDRRGEAYGRWRPSLEARRHGPTGELLERLVVRDGWSIEQALEMVRVNHRVVVDEATRALCERLARRAPSRTLVGEEEAGEIASDSPSPEASVLRAEHDFLARRAHAALVRARQQLPPMDQLILRMRFEDRMSIADIARTLHCKQRPLYRTVDRLLALVRERMAADGISQKDIDTLFADDAVGWIGGIDGATNADGGVPPPVEPARESWPQDQ